MTLLVKKSALSLQNNFTEAQINVIKNTIAKGASDEELELFLSACRRTGLDPFSRQIYSIKYGNNRTIQTSIDGFRTIASRNPDYAGQTTTLFCGKDGVWTEIWTADGYPFAAKVGIYRKGYQEPTFAIAKWNSYVQIFNGKPSQMWAKFPELMLGKCAEALALRKAFPNDLSGLYTAEEMSQAQTSTNEENETEPKKSEIKHIQQKNKKAEASSDIIEVKAEQEKTVKVPSEILDSKVVTAEVDVYDNKNLNHKEIFKKLILNIQSIKKIEWTPEDKTKITEAYQFFSSRCIGVPLNQLESHLLSIEREYQNAS